MMNEVHSNSLSIKEERIHALESRLKESMERNAKLQEQIKDLRTNYEALQQRREEDIVLQSAPVHRSR
jgi:predicted  nucleic acid-binding Zn-ribbon protein